MIKIKLLMPLCFPKSFFFSKEVTEITEGHTEGKYFMFTTSVLTDRHREHKHTVEI